jgi:hypothetical protein
VEQKPLQPAIIHDIAYINHYDTKSAWEWVNIKQKRGTCSGEETTKLKHAANVEYFFGINERTAEKERILGVATDPKNKTEEKSKPKSAKRTNSRKRK